MQFSFNSLVTNVPLTLEITSKKSWSNLENRERALHCSGSWHWGELRVWQMQPHCVMESLTLRIAFEDLHYYIRRQLYEKIQGVWWLTMMLWRGSRLNKMQTSQTLQILHNEPPLDELDDKCGQRDICEWRWWRFKTVFQCQSWDGFGLGF